MHELPITQKLLEQVLIVAEKNRLMRVNMVTIRLGALSGYVDESIDFYWRIIAKDTVAAKAEVKVVRTEGQVECLNCGKVMKWTAEVCPQCKSHRLKITAGNELMLQSVEGE